MLKHTVLLILVITSAVLSQNMISQGSLTIGGEVYYSETKNETSENYTFNASPQVSYFLTNNFEMGFALTWQSQSSGSTSLRTIGLTPHVAYYMTDREVRPFIGAGLMFTFNNFRVFGTDVENEGHALLMAAGIHFPINEKIAVQPSIQYVMHGGDGKSLGYMTQLLFGAGLIMFL